MLFGSAVTTFHGFLMGSAAAIDMSPPGFWGRGHLECVGDGTIDQYKLGLCSNRLVTHPKAV